MKKQIDLYFLYGSASYKPSCRASDRESGEILAYCTRDNWTEAEKAAINDAKKHYANKPVPKPKTIEIEVEDSWPDNVIELKETMVVKETGTKPPEAA